MKGLFAFVEGKLNGKSLELISECPVLRLKNKFPKMEF
ncbi:hypothetical protein LEP1GSC005_2961 [Leptospira santarosai str. ST188]|nr:hypothetical protein LEP1GSC005_2961 [Leptospira santarosai str. ST188]